MYIIILCRLNQKYSDSERAHTIVSPSDLVIQISIKFITYFSEPSPLTNRTMYTLQDCGSLCHIPDFLQQPITNSPQIMVTEQYWKSMHIEQHSAIDAVTQKGYWFYCGEEYYYQETVVISSAACFISVNMVELWTCFYWKQTCQVYWCTQ